MERIELPWIDSAATIKEGLDQMERFGAHGLVLVGARPRLLHYNQVLAGSKAGLRTLGDIPDSFELDSNQYRLIRTPRIERENFVTVEVRDTARAAVFLSHSPAHSCNGSYPHYYPPHERGTGSRCVVLGCNGTLP